MAATAASASGTTSIPTRGIISRFASGATRLAPPNHHPPRGNITSDIKAWVVNRRRQVGSARCQCPSHNRAATAAKDNQNPLPSKASGLTSSTVAAASNRLLAALLRRPSTPASRKQASMHRARWVEMEKPASAA